MPRIRKINDSQRARVLEVARVRQQLPSDKELAAESGVSISAIRKLMRSIVQSLTVSKETTEGHDAHR